MSKKTIKKLTVTVTCKCKSKVTVMVEKNPAIFQDDITIVLCCPVCSEEHFFTIEMTEANE